MRIKTRYPTWFDARFHAADKSREFGFAWVLPVNSDGYYRVAIGNSPDDAPNGFLSEYKDGVRQ